MKSIEVTISPTGEVAVEAVGFKGGACEAATKAIEEALGTVSDRKIKPEHHQTATGIQQRT